MLNVVEIYTPSVHVERDYYSQLTSARKNIWVYLTHDAVVAVLLRSDIYIGMDVVGTNTENRFATFNMLLTSNLCLNGLTTRFRQWSSYSDRSTYLSQIE